MSLWDDYFLCTGHMSNFGKTEYYSEAACSCAHYQIWLGQALHFYFFKFSMYNEL
jgi:hypothetical protein